MLDLALETGRQTRVHGASPRQHNVLVELRAQVDVGGLKQINEKRATLHNSKENDVK